MYLCSELTKTKRLFLGRGYDNGYSLDQRGGGVLLFGTAATTRTETLALGLLWGTEEHSVASQRAPGWAGRPAIDVSGAHGEKEGTVGARVPVNRGLPIPIRSLRCNCGERWLLFLVVHGFRLTRSIESIYPISDGKLTLHIETVCNGVRAEELRVFSRE